MTPERIAELRAAVDRNLTETSFHDPAKVCLSAVHANEWRLADMRDLLDALAAAEARADRHESALVACLARIATLEAALLETTNAAALAAAMLHENGLGDEYIARGHAIGIKDGFGVRARAALAPQETPEP